MKPMRVATVAVMAAALAGAAWAQAPADVNQRPALAAWPMAHLAIGTVKSVDVTERSATIDHQAITGLGLPAMTMPFHLSPSTRLVLKPGLSIAFTVTASADGLTIGAAQVIQESETTPPEAAPANPSMPAMDHAGMRGMPAMMDSCGDMVRGSP